MYNVEYLPLANTDIIEAEIYLYELNPAAVDKLTEAIDEKIGNIIVHPLMYPVYKHDERFRFVVLPYEYLLFYHVNEDSKILTIHRILRGMRDIPNVLQF